MFEKYGLTDNERNFLISIKTGKPQWGLLNIIGIEDLRAIKWKLTNIKKIGKKKHQELLENLKRGLRL